MTVASITFEEVGLPIRDGMYSGLYSGHADIDDDGNICTVELICWRADGQPCSTEFRLKWLDGKPAPSADAFEHVLSREIERQCSSQIYDALFDWSAAGFERRQAEYDANEAA